MDDQNKIIQVTKTGFAQLQDELADLIEVKRPALVARLERARGEGDLSENSDYTSAREDLDFLDGRIEELKLVIANAKVVPDEPKSTSKVTVGATVTVSVNGQSHDYKIVGEWEADPVNKKISHESPLGQALLNKKVGDEVEVEAPAGKIKYKVVSIS